MQEKSRVKLKGVCRSCGKTIRSGFTGQILKFGSCSCTKKAEEPADPETKEPIESSKKATAILPADLPVLGDDFEILSVVAHGGMGSVFKARDRSLDRIVAIKTLQKEMAEDNAARKRFEQEAESATKLDHPNLVSVYGHGRTEDGIPYLVMDFLEGESLAEVIEREGRMDAQRALEIFVQIAEALEHAHDKGIIHRDIKPTNIILTRTESGAELAKIVDFGIAKVLPNTSRETRDLTQTGEVFGSPHYMSPEQCLGFMLDQRSDIYSFGCTMYEVLTGAPPFAGSNPIQLVVKHINEEVDHFSREIKATRQMKTLETVVLHCLEKEQAGRFQSIEDLQRDLDALRTGRPVARYHVARKARPALTRLQVVGVVALAFLVFFYLTIGAVTWGGGSINTMFMALGVIIAVCLAGMYAFYMSAWQNLQKIRHGLGAPRQWWLALMQLSIALIGTSILPFLILAAFGWYNVDTWGEVVLFLGAGGQILACISTVSCLLWYFLPARDEKVRFPAIGLRLALTMILIAGMLMITFPKQTQLLGLFFTERIEKMRPTT